MPDINYATYKKKGGGMIRFHIGWIYISSAST